MMEVKMQIKEFTEFTGVRIRSLHYYGEIASLTHAWFTNRFTTKTHVCRLHIVASRKQCINLPLSQREHAHCFKEPFGTGNAQNGICFHIIPKQVGQGYGGR